MPGSVNPLSGEPPTGEPYAGEPHVRFGGGRSRVFNRLFLPLSNLGSSGAGTPHAQNHSKTHAQNHSSTYNTKSTHLNLWDGVVVAELPVGTRSVETPTDTSRPRSYFLRWPSANDTSLSDKTRDLSCFFESLTTPRCLSGRTPKSSRALVIAIQEYRMNAIFLRGEDGLNAWGSCQTNQSLGAG